MKLSSLLLSLTLLSVPATSLAQNDRPAKQRKNKAPDMDEKKTRELTKCMEKCQGPAVSCMEKCGDDESCSNRCGDQFSKCLLKSCEGLVPEPDENEE